jgi:hypothetical protein
LGAGLSEWDHRLPGSLEIFTGNRQPDERKTVAIVPVSGIRQLAPIDQDL